LKPLKGFKGEAGQQDPAHVRGIISEGVVAEKLATIYPA
jgi:hypothetical protein